MSDDSGRSLQQRYYAPDASPAPDADAFEACNQLGLTPHLNWEIAAAFIAWDQYTAYESFLQGVRSVPLGASLRRSADQPKGQVVDGAGPGRLPLEGATAGAKARIREAVRHSLSPHGRAGVWLSGGSDSAAVAAAAALEWRGLDRDPAHLRFYHLAPRSGPSEVDAASVVARHLGHPLVVHTEIAGDPMAGTEAFLRTLSPPAGAPGFSSELSFLQRLVDDGIEVYLTGDGGDECFGADEHGSVLRRALRRAVPGPLLRRRRERNARRSLPAWLAAHTKEIHASRPRPRPRSGLRGSRAERDRSIRCARQAAILEYHSALASFGGMQVDFPLLHEPVVDLAVALPPEVHGRHAGEKALLKAAFAEDLPRASLLRTKAEQPYVEEDYTRVLRSHGDDWWSRWVRSGPLVQAGLFDASDVEDALAMGCSGEITALYRAYCLLGICVWMDARNVQL